MYMREYVATTNDQRNECLYTQSPFSRDCFIVVFNLTLRAGHTHEQYPCMYSGGAIGILGEE